MIHTNETYETNVRHESTATNNTYAMHVINDTTEANGTHMIDGIHNLRTNILCELYELDARHECDELGEVCG